MKLFWRLLVLAAGLGFFGWYVYRVGAAHLWSTLRQLGPLAPLVLLPYLVVYVVDCLAWAQTLPRRGIPFLTLLRVRWAGESVNNVLPSVYVGGEAVKVCLLRAQGIGAAEGTAAAVTSKTAQTIAQMIFVLIGAVVLLFLASDRPGLRAGVLFVLLCGLAGLISLIWVQRTGFFRVGLAVLRTLRWRLAWVEKQAANLLHFDAAILSFYRNHPGKFHASTGLFLGGWLLDSVEIYLVASLLGMPISWSQALVMEAFTGVAKVLGMWVPGSLGVQESGIVLMGGIAGLPNTLSATYALVRRAREVIFAAVGLTLLYSRDNPRASTEVNARIQ